MSKYVIWWLGFGAGLVVWFIVLWLIAEFFSYDLSQFGPKYLT